MYAYLELGCVFMKSHMMLSPVQRPDGIAVPILPLAPERLDQAASTELIAPYLAECH